MILLFFNPLSPHSHLHLYPDHFLFCLIHLYTNFFFFWSPSISFIFIFIFILVQYSDWYFLAIEVSYRSTQNIRTTYSEYVIFQHHSHSHIYYHFLLFTSIRLLVSHLFSHFFLHFFFTFLFLQILTFLFQIIILCIFFFPIFFTILCSFCMAQLLYSFIFFPTLTI